MVGGHDMVGGQDRAGAASAFHGGLTLATLSEAETEALGERLARGLFPGAFIALYGGLGAGKTAFARGVGRGLGFLNVKSPTFAIVETHTGPLTLHHFDLYRLTSEQELYDIGFMEYLEDGGVILMEWPEYACAALPLSRLDAVIARADEPDTRSIRFIPRDTAHERLLAALEGAC